MGFEHRYIDHELFIINSSNRIRKVYSLLMLNVPFLSFFLNFIDSILSVQKIFVISKTKEYNYLYSFVLIAYDEFSIDEGWKERNVKEKRRLVKELVQFESIFIFILYFSNFPFKKRIFLLI